MKKAKGKIFADIDISLDGFVAGENISKDKPLGSGGERLIWYGDDVNDPDLEEGYDAVDAQVLREASAREGAVIMGRTTFDVSLDAWGDDPPIHKPCFVLTHRPRPMMVMKGGTSFTFVTSLDEALGRARRAANSRDIGVMGGAQTIRQFIKAGILDELHLHLVPVLLGGGVRLFDDLDERFVRLNKINVRDGNKVIHLLFRIIAEPSGVRTQ